MTALYKISKIWPQYLYALIIYSYPEQDADQQDCKNNNKKGQKRVKKRMHMHFKY